MKCVQDKFMISFRLLVNSYFDMEWNCLYSLYIAIISNIFQSKNICIGIGINYNKN